MHTNSARCALPQNLRFQTYFCKNSCQNNKLSLAYYALKGRIAIYASEIYYFHFFYKTEFES